MKENINQKIFCDFCRQDITFNNDKKGYFVPLEYDLIDHLIKNEESIIKKENHKKYIFCSKCYKEVELFLNWNEYKKQTDELRKTKCNICDNLLLKEKRIYTLYYLLYEVEETIKKICDDCWEENKHLTIGKYWKKVIVNPDKILVLDKDGNRVDYNKI